jgi:Sortase domain
MSGPGWSRRRRGVLTLALAAVVTAAVLVVVVLRAQVSAPQPHVAGRIDPSPSTSSPGRSHRGNAGAPAPLPASRPVSLRIPAIGVHTVVNSIGLAPNGTLAVPQPGPHLDQAAWFHNSPTPGQPGPSVIEGHVDSVEGPSVFLKLGDIRPGDHVVVRRADGRVLTFRVDAVRNYLKTRFPTSVVYGSRDLAEPTLRLITCSDFDTAIHHHIGNEVVFASLVHATAPSA